jgi:hypothetical protein
MSTETQSAPDDDSRVPAARRRPAATDAPSGITDLLGRAVAIGGATDASLVDRTTGWALDAAGAAPAAVDVADLVDAVLHGSAWAPGVASDSVEDVVVTTGRAHHLIRPVRTGSDPRVVLHLRLDRARGNLALARRQLAAIVDEFG